MMMETVRILADWSDDATHGVNALLSSVPIEVGVDVPEDVDVRNEFTDVQCARRQIPDDIDGNALLWSLYDDPVSQTNPGNRPWPPDASIPVLCRFCTNNTNTAAAARDASVTLRALWRSMVRFMSRHLYPAAETAATRNQVQLIHIESLDALTLYENSQNTVVIGAVLVRCRVRDLSAAT